MPENKDYQRLKKTLQEIGDDYYIVEEQVDVDIQSDYFSLSNKLKNLGSLGELRESGEKLFAKDVPIMRKKEILIALATSDQYEHFNTVRKYSEEPDLELKEWVIMAKYESRLTMESSLSDHKKVLISSGLGGSEDKLRYSMALISSLDMLEDFHKDVVFGELEYLLKKNNCVLEDVRFDQNLAIVGLLIPLQTNVHRMVTQLIDSINQFGGFISENYIITNVRKLSKLDIDQIVRGGSPSPTPSES